MAGADADEPAAAVRPAVRGDNLGKRRARERIVVVRHRGRRALARLVPDWPARGCRLRAGLLSTSLLRVARARQHRLLAAVLREAHGRGRRQEVLAACWRRPAPAGRGRAAGQLLSAVPGSAWSPARDASPGAAACLPACPLTGLLILLTVPCPGPPARDEAPAQAERCAPSS